MDELRPNNLNKLESSLNSELAKFGDEEVEAIIKVRAENYIPPGLEVRTRIDGQIFTCRIPAAAILKLEEDPDVVSISLGKSVGPIGNVNDAE